MKRMLPHAEAVVGIILRLLHQAVKFRKHNRRDSRLPGELPMLKTPAKKVTQTIAETDDLYGTPAYTEEEMVADFVPYALWCNRTPGEMQVWVRAQI